METEIYIGRDKDNKIIIGINRELVAEKSVEMLTESIITDNAWIKLYVTKEYNERIENKEDMEYDKDCYKEIR